MNRQETLFRFEKSLKIRRLSERTKKSYIHWINLFFDYICYESNSFSIMHRIILLKCELNYEAFSSVWYNCI